MIEPFSLVSCPHFPSLYVSHASEIGFNLTVLSPIRALWYSALKSASSFYTDVAFGPTTTTSTTLT